MSTVGACVDIVQSAVRSERPGDARSSRRKQSMPVSAQPLVHALHIAVSSGAFSEEQAIEVATNFTIGVSEAGLEENSDVFKLARERSRELLLFVKLIEAFPADDRSTVDEVTHQLVQSSPPQDLDALWILCGEAPLREQRGASSAVPQTLQLLASSFAGRLLEDTFLERRQMLAEALREVVQCDRDADYMCAVHSLRLGLSKVAFWRFVKLLESGEASRLFRCRFSDLTSESFIRRMEDRLSFIRSLEDRLGDTFENCSANVEAEVLVAGLVEGDAPVTTSSQLLPADAPQLDVHRLQVEILTAENLGSPEYRVGDITAGFFAKARALHPYVEVHCGGLKVNSQVYEAKPGGGATFAETLSLDLDSGGLQGDMKVTLIVRDQRGVQAALRGDPMIGEAVAALDSDAGAMPVRTVQLMRQGKRQGSLKCRFGVLAAKTDYEVLAQSESRDLAEVSRALVAVLCQPHGVDALLRCRPEVLSSPEVDGSSVLRRVLKAWVAKLRRQVAQAHEDTTEEKVERAMARLLREAQQVVAMCAWEEATAEDIQELTVCWIRSFAQLCAGQGGAPAALNEARLQRLLERAGHPDEVEDSFASLEAFGAALPEGTSEQVVLAVVRKLREAEASGDDEMFTQEALITWGRVTMDLGVVVRSGRDETLPHVFLYDLVYIQQWQREHSTDPSTRESLQARSIVPLTKVRG